MKQIASIFCNLTFAGQYIIINLHFCVNKIESLEIVHKSGRIETRALQKTIKPSNA